MATQLTVAIVGSGPSGFYAAASLLGCAEPLVSVDMFERLPTPWGLVRAGVAPDHPRIKSVSTVFDKTAAHNRFRFFGNVEVGNHVSRHELIERYDAVLYAVGSQVGRRLGVPGEDLPGSFAAGDFVGWYNGHPDYRDMSFDLSGPRAVVIGNGNVALDVARILCTPSEQLSTSDIADHALQELRASGIDEVVVVGRRGATQAAFTTPELQELHAMARARVDVDPAEVHEIVGTEEELSSAVKRNLDVLREYAEQEGPTADRRKIVLRFLRSPVEIRGTDRVEAIVLARNELRVDELGALRAFDTGVREVLEASLVLSAVGYLGKEISGVPFDHDRGVIPNENGRVQGGDREYVTGWIKRGPSGIIGTNRKCAAETVRTLLADVGGMESRAAESSQVESWLRARRPELVDLGGWQRIDEAERGAGRSTGRPRVKLVSAEQLLAAAGVHDSTI